ncbi:MAG: hypothetical protein KDK70_42615, partial [Myxococcales bacterium]|nr:hypothetical protein [Myxococcales bacterium]
MPGVPSVRRLEPSEWRVYRELRLRALAESPDAFGSTLARERERSDEQWQARVAEGARSPSSLGLVAEVDGEPIGLAWGRIEGA